ncbi:DNA circularization N-terminal domain-containing protein [Shewanella sp. D64]|uniref:DNA circularization N-terminal domain-containing protein n=1 Tax=unclassified Shewanella TaxID=196818 RepID=UPI0022BA34A5|nr:MULTISPECIES: DNA circularization N-terminal domain-containing protein [unclassified Shewanella]MEC4728162.1 DNA circularization N-terminal domain-containing protein [Shewanella sp. D64]MEC4740282.1 DNA circularization N-terminal domain-containing protein [Shewanella sp. E94]WBJ94403.1 DNA circularization N-terminal domain-containing protein [Shewanella sp. MTB7]
MWERKYEKGRWSGLELNILSTTIDGGQRLHISEIPYADLPMIKVMGSAASNLSLEVVMVGVNSLADANALLAKLASTPRGELEHPWLGELPLVFESHSLKIDTKRGLVTLSLTFVFDGKAPTLHAVVIESVFNAETQADVVITASTPSFVEEVDDASVAQTNTIRASFTSVVTRLQRISNRLAVPSQILSELNTELNSALVSISSIANAPGQFAEQLSKTVKHVAKVVRTESRYASSGEGTSTLLASEAVDNARMAQAAMLELIDPDSPSHHFNVQLVIAAMLMSRDIAALEQRDKFVLAPSTTQPAFILNDLQRIVSEIDARIDDATSVSTIESLALFNALVVLKDGISVHIAKVVKGSSPTLHDLLPRPIPALALAHEHHAELQMLTSLNPAQHPLFLCGTVAIEVAS